MTSNEKPSPPSGRPILIVGIIVALVVAVVGFVYAPTFFDLNVPGLEGEARSSGITGVRQAVLLVAGGIIAAATLLQTAERDRFTRRKYEADIMDAENRFDDLREQRAVEQIQYKEQRELDQERLRQQRTFDTEKELRARFVAAAELLTGDKPVMRTAGAYAMAALADEWERTGNRTERQVCIDVLCAYLRAPWNPQADGSDEEALVRSTIFNIIADHLRPTGTVSWQQAIYNLTRARIAFDCDLSRIEVQTGTVLSLVDTEFTSGFTNFRHADFTGGTADFTTAKFTGGTVDFGFAEFAGGTTNFSFAQFTDGTADFRGAKFTGGTTKFRGAEFTADTTNFSYAKFSGGTVDFTSAQFVSGTTTFNQAEFTGGTTNFSYAKFTGGTVDFTSAQFVSGTTTFNQAEFDDGTVDFIFTEFTGGIVNFISAKFTGGTVNFHSAQFVAGTVDFDDAPFVAGTVDFGGAKFIGGTVSFRNAWLAGGTVDLHGVTGQEPGLLDFRGPSAWDVPPRVPWSEDMRVPNWVKPRKWPPELRSGVLRRRTSEHGSGSRRP